MVTGELRLRDARYDCIFLRIPEYIGQSELVSGLASTLTGLPLMLLGVLIELDCTGE